MDALIAYMCPTLGEIFDLKALTDGREEFQLVAPRSRLTEAVDSLLNPIEVR